MVVNLSDTKRVYMNARGGAKIVPEVVVSSEIQEKLGPKETERLVVRTIRCWHFKNLEVVESGEVYRLNYVRRSKPQKQPKGPKPSASELILRPELLKRQKLVFTPTGESVLFRVIQRDHWICRIEIFKIETWHLLEVNKTAVA